VIGGILNSVVIIFMNALWRVVGTKLTEWENHRTQTEFDDSLITKIFIFQFVNSYVSLYYIAFFKNGNPLWAQSEEEDLRDVCKFQFNDCKERDNLSRGCADELTMQLITILATNMLFGQTKEVLVPYIMSKVKLMMLKRKVKEAAPTIPQWEKECKLGNWMGIFDEYAEMVIQYGYISLFACAFPFAALLAWMNNMVEIRTDAFKLLTATTRPGYKGAQDIGRWYYILEILGYIAVITNCFLIAFTYDALTLAFGGTSVEDVGFKVFGVIIALEHVIFFSKFLLSLMIPDVPGEVRKELARQTFIKNEILKKLAPKPERKWEAKEEDDDFH